MNTRFLEWSLSEASAEERTGEERSLEEWTDEELKNEFGRFYYKPLYHPTERSRLCSNAEDFALCDHILQVLISRGYNKKQVVEEGLPEFARPLMETKNRGLQGSTKEVVN